MSNASVTCALLAMLALLGCSDEDVDPITRIRAPRVLAVVSEPSVLAIDGEVRLDALTVDALGPRTGIGESAPPNGRPVQAVRMRACVPWKFIADPSRDCVGGDALDLVTDDAGRFVVAAAELVTAFPPPAGAMTIDALRTALAAGLELRVPIIAEVDVDGETLVARRDLWVAETTGELDNPQIAEVRFDGVATRTLRADQRYSLTVAFDRQSLDPPRDAPDPGTLETITSVFYSPSGELADHEVDLSDPDADVPETEANTYTAGPRGDTWLYVVATDETGGMTADWVPLRVE